MSLLFPFRINAFVTPYADSEGPDQTALLRSLIWSFAVRLQKKLRI